jgi:hypothetical protein
VRAGLAGAALAAGTFLKPTAVSLLLAAFVWLLLRRRPAVGRAGALLVGFAAVWAMCMCTIELAVTFAYDD